MRSRLFIRLISQTGTEADASQVEASWLDVDSAGKPTDIGQGLLRDAAALAIGRQVIVLVPAADVLLTHATVPSQNRQRILKAIPYALEERLGSEVEQLHFALGRREAGNQINTAVVSRGQMDTWLDGLQTAGIQPDMLVPETLALPTKVGTWFVLKEGMNATLRSSLQSGFAVDVENLEPILQLAIAEAQEETKPERLYIIDCDQDNAVQPEHLARALNIEVTVEICSEQPLAVLIKEFDPQNTINLLEGDYSQREHLNRLWRPWRPAAALFGLWLILQGGLAVAEVTRLSRVSEALQPQIEQIYRQAFPEVRNIVNARVQMERALEELRAGQLQDEDGFLELMGKAGGVLKDAPNLTLRSVSYKEGELNLDLQIQDLQALDQLKTRLTEQSGLGIEIQSATSREGSVESRMQIRPAGNAEAAS